MLCPECGIRSYKSRLCVDCYENGTYRIPPHGTPHVNYPDHFSNEEASRFVDFVNQDRYVSREEQVELYKQIMAERQNHG